MPKYHVDLLMIYLKILKEIKKLHTHFVNSLNRYKNNNQEGKDNE